MMRREEHLKFLKRLVLDIDPFVKHHKLIRNRGFSKSGTMYCSQNTVKSIKIQ